MANEGVEFLTVSDLARAFGKGSRARNEEAILHAIACGELPSTSVAGKTYINRVYADAWIFTQSVGEIEGALFTGWATLRRFFPEIAAWATTVSKKMPVVSPVYPLSIETGDELIQLSSRAVEVVENLEKDKTLSKADRDAVEILRIALRAAHKEALVHWRHDVRRTMERTRRTRGVTD